MNCLKVSVITPCLNAENTISETIDSVIAQVYQNWELILVDDCSTDNTSAIINKYLESDMRIHYYKTEANTGSPSIPRNIAISHAQGEYIAFLDSDDFWLPNKLIEQIEYIESQRYDFIYSNYEKISYSGVRKERIIYSSMSLSYNDILKSNGIPCLTVLIRKSIIQDIYFRDCPKEDYVFWLELLRKRNIKAYNTAKVHALYRETYKSRSGNKLKMITQQWFILRDIEHVNVIKAFCCLSIYAIKGLIKYLK